MTETGGPHVDVELDERGNRCPAPVIALGKAAAREPAGSVVVVLSDDPASASDIPAWCRMRGAQFLGAEPVPDGRGGQAYRVQLPG